MPAHKTIRTERKYFRLSEAVATALERKARLLGISEALLVERELRKTLNLPEFAEGEYD